MLYGIALIDSLPFRIKCDVSLVRGRGEILISGPVEETIEETINVAIRHANELSDFEDTPFPNLANFNLHIRVRLPAASNPITGPSWGLLLSLELILCLLRRRPTFDAFVTEEIDSRGDVLRVGDIEGKRNGAKTLGGERIILPSRQLDFFNSSIIQIPVSNLFEAYRAVTYGET